MKMTDSTEGKQNVTRALLKRLNMSSWCVRSRVSPRAGQITSEGEKHTQTKEEKESRKSHRHKPTNRHGGGSMFMTPHSHLHRFHTHTHTETCAHAADHTLPSRSV